MTNTFRAYCDRRAEDNEVLAAILARLPSNCTREMMLAVLTEPALRRSY